MSVALDSEQKSKVRQYLGYFNLENRSILSASQPIVISQQGVLEANMDSILDTFSRQIIIDLITDIDCSRCEIKAAKQRLMASEVQYAVKMNRFEINMRWQEDLKLCNQLANLLATPLYWHPTGAGIGNPGGSAGNMYNGGGSIRLLDSY